jgi:hypothetical protein
VSSKILQNNFGLSERPKMWVMLSSWDGCAVTGLEEKYEETFRSCLRKFRDALGGS